MLVMEELLCSQSNEGLGSRNDHNLTFSSWLLCREVWVASIFIGVWLPASNLIHFSPLWKEGCSPGGFITGSAAEISHFIMADVLIFISKKETRLLWLELPLAAPQQLFLEIYRISALLREDLPSGVFTHSSIDGSPCCLQTARLRGCFTPILCHGKENNPLAKKELERRIFLVGKKKTKKKLRRSAPP